MRISSSDMKGSGRTASNMVRLHETHTCQVKQDTAKLEERCHN